MALPSCSYAELNAKIQHEIPVNPGNHEALAAVLLFLCTHAPEVGRELEKQLPNFGFGLPGYRNAAAAAVRSKPAAVAIFVVTWFRPKTSNSALSSFWCIFLV